MVLLGTLRVPESDLLEYLNYLSLAPSTELVEYLLWFSKDPLFFAVTYFLGQVTQISWIYQGFIAMSFLFLLWSSLQGFGRSRTWIWILLITSSYVFSLELHLIRQMLALAVYIGVVSMDRPVNRVYRTIVAALLHFSFIPFIILELALAKMLNVKAVITIALLVSLMFFLPGISGLFKYAILRSTAESYLEFGSPSIQLVIVTVLAPFIAFYVRGYKHGSGLLTRIMIVSTFAIFSLNFETEIFYRTVPIVLILLLLVLFRSFSRSREGILCGVCINIGTLIYFVFYGKWSYYLL